jgi:F420-dependent oxidoreductase-like protein
MLGWLAGHTERIRIGSAILQIPARSAAMTAMTAATLDQLSDGRLVLGLGVSGPLVSEGLHGQRFDGQLKRTREYVEAVRLGLAGERIAIRGETLQLPLPDGPGKALKLTIAPQQERVPIYLAALGPRATELAGEIADGWLPLLFLPEHSSEFRRLLERGAARAGRSLEGFSVTPAVPALVSDEPDLARDAARGVLAFYLGGMGPRDGNFYNQLVRRYGFEDDAIKVQDLFLDGKRDEAMAAVPAKLIDQLTLCGPAEHIRDRLAAYRDAGVETVSLSLLAQEPQERIKQLRRFAEIAG